jgi:tetratricopeptide (TPR) repeat protein
LNSTLNRRSIIRTLIGIAIFLPCLSPVAWAGEWVSIRSANFLVAGEVTETEIRSVATRLEQFRDTFRRLFPRVRTVSKGLTRVVVFRDPESYRDFRPRNADGLPDDGVAGYFLPGEAASYITVAMRGGKTDPYHTIFHEYVHFILNNNAGRIDIPPWLGEGLAQYFETMRSASDGTAVIGEPPQGRGGTLRRGIMLPWRDVLTAERRSFNGKAESSRSMFYAQSWLLVHYLMHQGNEAPQERLDRFLDLLNRGGSVEAAIKDVFDIEPAHLDRLLLEYLRIPALPATTTRLPGSPDSAVEYPPVPMKGSQVRAVLGDLLLYMDRLDEAEPHLRSAIAGDDGLASAHASLGFLLIRRDRVTEALKHLEIGVTKGSPSYFDYFNYAHSLSLVNSKGGMVNRFPEPAAGLMRQALKRSIELEPAFPESYRLLAYLNYVNGENTAEAASLLEKGLSLRPGDTNLEMLLARIRVRQERIDEARAMAEKLSKVNDAHIRKEAGELLDSITQFTRAKLEIKTSGANRALPWSPDIVLLKRSWVNEADLAAVEKFREIANLNRLIEQPRPGEERILGTIDRIECSKGTITYHVRSGGERIRFIGDRFDDVRMRVLVIGEHTFQIDCGVRLPANPVVLFYDRTAGTPSGDKLRLTSITFVPDNFELWPPGRLAASRTIIVEDDLVKRTKETTEGFVTKIATPEARWASITKNLRRPDQGELRVSGSLEAIECSEGGYTAIAVVQGRRMRFVADAGLVPVWFSVAASQVPLACGAQPQVANVLFTYTKDDVSLVTEPRLESMEFLPDGFPLEKIIEPLR